MKLVLAIFITGLLFCCSQSEKERKALQQEREDSIRTATEKATRLRMEKIQSLKDLLAQTESEKEGMGNRLSMLKAELEVAKDKLTTIKQYQFLRTPSEREEQVRAQALAIELLENEITTTLNELANREEVIRKTKTDLKSYELTANKQ